MKTTPPSPDRASSGGAPALLAPAALLFDLDGTLTDSEPMWAEALRLILAEMSCPFTEDETVELVYGRPGLFVRATRDPAGIRWEQRIEVLKPGQLGQDACSYASLLPLIDNTALIAYSEFNVPGPDGAPRKSIRVRTVRASLDAKP